MCGIAGILCLAPRTRVEPEPLDSMTAQLVHRGPDDAGRYIDPRGRCGLGFRRLAIIDLAGGRQPLSTEDGTIWLVFNGEIYNFRELRKELEAAGHRFATRTDSEVIVHLYEQAADGDVGRDCLARLAGMFAFAIWDERRGRLLLARDRLGKKPLVYAQHGDFLYFASELKAIAALPAVPRAVDPQALHAYFVFQYVPAPRSIYRGFGKLLPGHYLDLHAGESPDLRPRRYWALRPTNASPRFGGTYADARARLGELLTAAVAKRLIADVPLGAFLSGGVDSSVVVALMRALGVSPLRTFSIGFPDPRYDETRYARLVADRFKTEHHEHLVTPQAREILDTLSFHYDEPFADSSAIPTYYVARWARQRVTVALTGDGGDECFGGYDRYRAAQLAERLAVVPRPLRRGLSALGRLLPHHRPRTASNRLYRFLSALEAGPARRYLAWVNVFTPADLLAGYRAEFAAALDFDEPWRWFDGLYGQWAGSATERAVLTDIHSYLPYDLLVKVDIASMACGLECRCPLLDHELLEFAAGLPIEWRIGPRGGKRILKDWAKGRLPAAVLRRRKMGFGVPIGSWLRWELQDLLRTNVLAADSLSRRVFSPDWLERLVEEHIRGRANHEHPLWALLTLELWSRRWRPIGLASPE